MVHHHETAAAQVAGIGQGYRQGKTDAHSRIDGVAAALQNVQPDARGQFLLGGDHAVLGHHRVEHVHIKVVGRTGRLGGGGGLHGSGYYGALCGRGRRAATGGEAGQRQGKAAGQQRVGDVHGSVSGGMVMTHAF